MTRDRTAIGLVYVVLMFGGAAWAFHGRATRHVIDFFSTFAVSHAHMVRIAEGFGLAITLTHYVLDASAWKLTKPEARAVMVQKYNFLLGSSKPPRAAVSRAS